MIYAIVPKNQTTIENIILTRAEQVANEQVIRVAHTVSLEAQAIDPVKQQKQKDGIVRNLLERLNKKIWETEKKQKNLSSENQLKKLIENLSYSISENYSGLKT